MQKRRKTHLEETAKGLMQRQKSDPFTWPDDSQKFISLDKFLDEFTLNIKSNLRMSFWRSENGNHKWVSQPESHAKCLLLASLLSKLGRSALIFEEITSGAGYIDIYVMMPNGEKAGISVPYLSQLETSKRKGSLDVLTAIAKVLQVSLENIVPSQL